MLLYFVVHIVETGNKFWANIDDDDGPQWSEEWILFIWSEFEIASHSTTTIEKFKIQWNLRFFTLSQNHLMFLRKCEKKQEEGNKTYPNLEKLYAWKETLTTLLIFSLCSVFGRLIKNENDEDEDVHIRKV